MRRRGSFPLLALIALALLVGHDAVMAANPHGQEPAHGHHAKVGQGTSSCFMIEGAQADRPDLPAPSVGAANMPMAPDWEPLQTVSAIAWLEAPAHPPDVRRAMLQVFLN